MVMSTEIESVVNRALAVTIKKMHDSYLNKHKINVNEADGIKRAIGMYCL